MSLKQNVVDKNGFDVLKIISKADAFNAWMHDTIRPYMQGHILEIGSGIGNISRQFIQSGSTISLSDIDPYYLQCLEEQFHLYPNVQAFLSIDLQHPNFKTEYAHLEKHFDSVFLLNVLEHLENHTAAINNCIFLLKPKGTLLILVPAYPLLFSTIDVSLGHHRRYTKVTLCHLLESVQLEVKKSFYFNAFGIVGWLYSKLLQLRKFPQKEMAIFNRLVPLIKWIDVLLLRKVGLSVISVAITPESKNP